MGQRCEGKTWSFPKLSLLGATERGLSTARAKNVGGSCAANVGADISQKEETGIHLAVCKSACAYRLERQLGGLFR